MLIVANNKLTLIRHQFIKHSYEAIKRNEEGN